MISAQFLHNLYVDKQLVTEISVYEHARECLLSPQEALLFYHESKQDNGISFFEHRTFLLGMTKYNVTKNSQHENSCIVTQ